MKHLLRVLPIVLACLLAACGTVATPEWAAEVQETQVALAATAAYETSIAPTATPTEPPTATPLEPTATPIPPTEIPTNTPELPTATFTPTAIPTQVAAVADTVNGDPANGNTLFHEMRAEVGFACATCHNTDTEARLIGPGLKNVGTRAATRVQGQSAVEYIHNSILHPNDFIVPPDATGPFPPNLMPQIYSQVWTEQQLNDIIAYLLTL